MRRANLKIVEATVDPPVDLYAKWKADRERIDWSRVHITGDRAKPVFLPDHKKWGYR